MNNAELILSAHRALLFNIKSNVRFIYLDYQSNFIKLWIYLDSTPTDEDFDTFYSVIGEMSGDFPEINDSKNEVEIFVSQEKFEDIKKLQNLIYARYET